MKKKLIIGSIIVAGLLGTLFYNNAYAPSGKLGSASVFNSGQVGTGAASGSILQTNGTVSVWTPTSTIGSQIGALLATNNLSDVTNSSTARTNLGVPGLESNNTFTASNTFQQGFVAYASSFIFGSLNTYFIFPTPSVLASGTTCGVTTNVTDVGTCYNDIYAYGQTLASTTNIIMPSARYTSSQWLIPAVFGVQGALVYIEGASGNGTNLTYGSSTGAAITLNDCNSNAKRHALQISGIHISGVTATTTNGGTTGIFAGGANGACATQIDNVIIGNFTYGLITDANTYLFEFSNSHISGVGRALWQKPASNSGESMLYFNDMFVDPGGTNGSSSPLNYVFLDTNSTASTQIIGGSIDNAQLSVACGNLSVNVSYVHMENPAKPSSYDYINESSCSNGATNLSISYMDLMNDGPSSTSTPAEFVNAGSWFNSSYVTLTHNNVGLTVARFVNNTNSTSNAIINLDHTNNLGGGVTALFPIGNSAVTDDTGWLSVVFNSFAQGWVPTSNNCLNGVNGGGVALSICIPNGASNLFPYIGIGGVADRASSTLDIGGSLGLANNLFTTSTTIPTNSTGNNYIIWIYTGAATGTTLTLPVGSQTQNRVAELVNVTSHSVSFVATSTDTIVTGTTTAQTSTAVAGGAIQRLINVAGTWYNW